MKDRFILLTLLILLLPNHIYSQKKITILHTNDIHSAVLGDEFKETGISQLARISGIIHNEKDTVKNPVLALDGGDFLMGTLFQMLEMNSGFELHLMQQMGYDAVCLGNHEFDYGVENLKKYIQKAQESGCPPVLFSNVGRLKKDGKDVLNTMFQENLLSKYKVIDRDGVKVGIFAILGNDAYDCAPNLYPYELEDVIKTARTMVRFLRDEQKVDMVICLSHNGVLKDKKGEWEMEGDVKLAEKVKGIDLIISGHTHTLLQKPLVINDTPIVQVGTKARFVGRIDMSLGTKNSFSYKIINVDSVLVCDQSVNNSVMTQLKNLKDTLQIKAGLDYDHAYLKNDFPLSFVSENPHQTGIGNFVADALYYDVNKNSTEGTNITLMGQGVIRAGLNIGTHSLSDIYRVASLGSGKDVLPGYPLSTMYFTAHEIKQFLELLEMVSANNPTYYCFKSGIRLTVDSTAGMFHKIKKMEMFKEGEGYKSIDFSKKNQTLYSVTADSYMMSFMTLIKKKSHGLIHVTPKYADGTPVKDFSSTIIDMDKNKPGVQEGKVWKSLIDYAASFKDKDENNIPIVPDKYHLQ